MTQNKKSILYFVAVFIVIETAAVFYAVSSVKSLSDSQFRPVQVLRIGILPDVSQKYSERYWHDFIKLFADDSDGFIVEPYIAHSYSELLTGFSNGSLDIIYVNPATYQTLNENGGLELLACQRLTVEGRDKNRSILITNKEIEFLNQTRGLRLTFVDKFSLTGYIIPYNSLVKSLSPTKLSDWFSEISFAPTKSQAFNNMINGETDIVAIDKLSLLKIMDYLQYSDTNLKELWVSRTVPGSVLCCYKSFAETNENFLKKFRAIIQRSADANERVSTKQISFELIESNYKYQEQLKSLKKYIENLKSGRKRSNVLMKIGGE